MYGDKIYDENGLNDLSAVAAAVKLGRKLVMFFNESTQVMTNKLKNCQRMYNIDQQVDITPHYDDSPELEVNDDGNFVLPFNLSEPPKIRSGPIKLLQDV